MGGMNRRLLSSIERALYRRARARLQRIADEVPPVSAERFAADHGVTLPEQVDAETRAVEVRFGAIGLRRRGYAGFWERSSDGRYRRRRHIVLNVALRCDPPGPRARTFLHELAHIIAGPGEHHGPRWKEIAASLGIGNPGPNETLAITLGPGNTSAYDRETLTDDLGPLTPRQPALFS